MSTYPGQAQPPPPKPNNYPPFTCIPRFKPCFYQNIDEEIPPETQKTVRWAYWSFLGFGIYYVYQLIASIASWAVTNNLMGILYFFLAVGQILILIPVNYVLWFRVIYNAFKHGGSRLNFTVFFVVSALTIVWMILVGLGIPGFTPGIINGIEYCSYGGSNGDGGFIFVGLLMLFCGLFAFALVGVEVFLFLKVRKIYQQSGASLTAQAQSAPSDMGRTMEAGARELNRW